MDIRLSQLSLSFGQVNGIRISELPHIGSRKEKTYCYLSAPEQGRERRGKRQPSRLFYVKVGFKSCTQRKPT
jgi:hypothetical protein